ncbi:MAG TPA: hypothetical protein VGG18_05905 [Granulicella sp.]|jgi:hypothetical protein
MDEQQPPYMPEFDVNTREGKIRAMRRDLQRYDPRRLQITREELDELGIEYDGDDLYVKK